MNIVVYADESGTHDLSSKQPGSNVAVLAGYSGMEDDWDDFCGEWQKVLNEFDVPVFHFSQFANKKLCAKDKKSPYYEWSGERRHEFLFKLAAIAGKRVRFPFASAFHLADFHANPAIKSRLGDLGLSNVQINGPHIVYLGLFADFFEQFIGDLKVHKPNFNESISFVFDRKDSDKFWGAAAQSMFQEYGKRDSRFRSIMFDDKRKTIPLQAADMIAYRMHQIWENSHKEKKSQTFRPLDYALWGNFEGNEDMKEYLRKLLGRELKQITR